MSIVQKYDRLDFLMYKINHHFRNLSAIVEDMEEDAHPYQNVIDELTNLEHYCRVLRYNIEDRV